MENRLLPVLFNPDIAFLVEFGKLNFDLDVTLPSLDTIQESVGTQSKQQTELIKSGIMVGLNKSINRADDDFEEITFVKFTGDIVSDGIIKDDVADFYENRITIHATRICDYIDGLIKLDRYPKKMFGEYKRIKHYIDSTYNNKEKARGLNQLCILAKQMVPIDVLYPPEEVVEGSILSSTQVTMG